MNAEISTKFADPSAPPYERLRSLNVSEKIEKKNGLSYLSWAFAVDELLKADPLANWEYPSPTVHGGDTLMVYCAVTAFGKTMTAHLPVMDHKNQAIPMPNAFQLNTAMQRCLVKAIALHGIGLYIYAGEDLPAGESAPANGSNGKKPPEQQTAAQRSKVTKDINAYAKRVLEALDMDLEGAACDVMREAKEVDAELAINIWRTFPGPIQQRLRKIQNETDHALHKRDYETNGQAQ